LRSLPELTKLYYTISEVADMFEVSTSLLRYWETEFPSLKPKKDRRGDRKFQVKDIKELQRIHHLVKERGFTLEGAKKELKEGYAKPVNTEDLRKRLIALKAKIQAQISNLKA